jgi:hypothetical protein
MTAALLLNKYMQHSFDAQMQVTLFLDQLCKLLRRRKYQYCDASSWWIDAGNSIAMKMHE